MDNDDDYEIGYGKPPKKHQFKKGQSGNPKGRPKAETNPAEILKKVLLTPQKVMVNGEKLSMTGLEIILHKAYEQARNGDFRAMKLLLPYMKLEQENPINYPSVTLINDIPSIDDILTQQEIAEIRKASGLPPKKFN
jgi:hypothetical protein